MRLSNSSYQQTPPSPKPEDFSFSQRVSTNIATTERFPLAPPSQSAQPHPLLAWRSPDVRSAPELVKGHSGGGSALGSSVLGGSARLASCGWDGCRQAHTKAATSTLQFHGSVPARGRTPFQGPALGARAPKALRRRQHW